MVTTKMDLETTVIYEHNIFLKIALISDHSMI